MIDLNLLSFKTFLEIIRIFSEIVQETACVCQVPGIEIICERTGNLCDIR